jgi:hypothetical protein
MIRDPSDGSVRHQPKPLETKVHVDEQPVLVTTTSGLPITKAKAEYLVRLNWSRDWLKDYFNPKEQA